MKGKLSSFEIGMIVAFSLVAVLGGAGYYYTTSQLSTLVDAAGTVQQQLTQVVRRGYLPTPRNADLLTANNKLNSQAMADIESKLKSDKNLLSKVTIQGPIDFKQDLANKVKQTVDDAHKANVGLPTNFYLTFSRFKSENPDEKSTVVLGKQLIAVQQLSELLFASEIIKIDGMKRSFEEEAPRAESMGAAGNSGPGEQLSTRMVVRPYYTVYPFQVDFTCTTASLRQFLGDLLQSPYLFIVRSIQVVSSKPVPPKMADLETMDAGGAGTGPRAPKIVLGDEVLQVYLRVDLVEWVKSDAASAPTDRPAPGGRRN